MQNWGQIFVKWLFGFMTLYYLYSLSAAVRVACDVACCASLSGEYRYKLQVKSH
jgi:hypothetical protein